MADKLVKDIETLLQSLKKRFEKNIHRHPGINWSTIETILQKSDNIMWSIQQMELSEGEPDVLLIDDVWVYCDCSPESPKGRRSLCYDKKAWESRKENKPIGNVIDMANAMGIELLNQEQYHQIQKIEDFDLKTSSWLLTPEAIRSKKGAIFGDKRYDHVFIYHNGAESYYAARGFRGLIKLPIK